MLPNKSSNALHRPQYSAQVNNTRDGRRFDSPTWPCLIPTRLGNTVLNTSLSLVRPFPYNSLSPTTTRPATGGSNHFLFKDELQQERIFSQLQNNNQAHWKQSLSNVLSGKIILFVRLQDDLRCSLSFKL
jgi:hypothetical protein